MDREQLAKDAERIGKEPLLQHALDEMRKDALEKLIDCDSGDNVKVAQYQAQVRAVDEFRDLLVRYMREANAIVPIRGAA